MDKQAFKQRMQNLKSYRENNPGKGYWDWRNSLPDNLKYTDDTEYNMRGAYESGAQPILENDGFYHLPTRNPQTGEILKTSLHPTFWKGLAEDAKIGYNTYFVGDKVYTKSKEEGPINVYADGGEVARKSLKDIRKESIIEDKLDYDVMLQNQNAYQKEFATNWYKQRANNPKYNSQLGEGKLDKILSDINKATWKNPTEAMRDNLTSQGYSPTDQNIKSQLQAIDAKGTKGFAVPSMYSYYGAPRNTWHEGVGHIVGDNNPAILDSTPNVSIPSNDPLDYTGIMPVYPIPSYKYGGIHIKKKNRGKFNALKKRTGKTTEELTHSKNPLTRKRAIFAQNARRWKHKGRKKNN